MSSVKFMFTGHLATFGQLVQWRHLYILHIVTSAAPRLLQLLILVEALLTIMWVTLQSLLLIMVPHIFVSKNGNLLDVHINHVLVKRGQYLLKEGNTRRVATIIIDCFYHSDFLSNSRAISDIWAGHFKCIVMAALIMCTSPATPTNCKINEPYN